MDLSYKIFVSFCARFSPGNVWTPMWENGAKTSGDYEGTVLGGTDAQLLGRMGTSEECGLVCLFLAADATFCTGKTFTAIYTWNLKLKCFTAADDILCRAMKCSVIYTSRLKLKWNRDQCILPGWHARARGSPFSNSSIEVLNVNVVVSHRIITYVW